MHPSYPGAGGLATFLVWTLLLFTPVSAPANDYGVFIDVETEEDLLDLLGSQEIDEDDFETLRELLSDGVDLNTAGRDELYLLPNLTYAEVDAILEYRDEAGSIAEPPVLVTVGALSERKLLAIVAFLLVSEPDRPLYDTRGRLRYLTTWVGGDEEVPSMVLRGELSTLRNLDVGIVGVLTRTRVSDVLYDPNRSYLDGTQRGALSAEPPAVQAQLPKFYVQWKTDDWHLVAGTYRVGFGQRLTFDNSSQYTPNGIRVDDTIYYSQDLSQACRESAGELPDSPCAGEAGASYASPDYRWTDRLRGAAVGLRKARLGDGWLQAYGFFSYQTHSIYQYETVDRRFCDDPLDDELEACKAPSVFLRGATPLAPATKLKFATLPDMYNLLTGGANLSYYFGRRSHVGVTGYGADVTWLADGIDLDFQEWSRLPFGGPFGAVGVDAAWGAGLLDLFLEVTRSFDAQPGGGGFAGILRSTLTWKKHEVEVSARYYDKDFANPFARPVSAADEFDGLRARNEYGLRARYLGHLGDLDLRATGDLWVQTPQGEIDESLPKTRVELRADYELETWLRPGVWLQYQDRNLSEGGRDNCFELAFETIEGEPVPCSGEKLQAGAQLRFVPLQRLSVTAKYQHRWLDDKDYADRFRQDIAGWLVVVYWPIEDLRLRFRLRYLFEDIDDNESLEQSVWAYLEASYRYERSLMVKLRYEVYKWLDDRANTQLRDPDPAHWVRVELEYRF